MKATTTTLTLICISLVLIGMFLPQSSANVNPKNIVGLWLFDEGAGNAAKDSSGNGNDGEFEGNPKWVEGKFGKAVQYNGTNQSMIAKSKGLPTGGKDRTLALWVKSQNMAAGNKYIAGWGASTNQQMFALVMGLGNVPSRLFGFWGWGNDLPSKAPLKDDTWYHLAFTLEKTTGTLYLDGEVDNEGPKVGLSTPENTNFRVANSPIVITYFAATIDEVAVFDMALPKDDIKTLIKGMRAVTAVSPSDKLTTTWGRIKNYE